MKGGFLTKQGEENFCDNCFTSQKTVNIPISLYESTKGRYFVGQSETLWVGDGSYAWAGLFNPNRSGVLLHANVITISNFSDEYITAEIWLNAKLEGEEQFQPRFHLQMLQ